jgi:mono/diheme cytochrome c family protein
VACYRADRSRHLRRGYSVRSAGPPSVRASATRLGAELPRTLTGFTNNLCYREQNWQHDAAVRTSDGVYPFVRVWYSPSLFNWMTVLNRQGPVPDGAIVVKEQYQTLTAPMHEQTVRVKDSTISWDGWYWADLVFPSPADPNAPPPKPATGRAEPQVQFNGTGLYCVNCHASAINNQGTYSSTEYISPHGSIEPGEGSDSTLSDGGAQPQNLDATQINSLEAELAPRFGDHLPSAVLKNLRPLQQVKVPCIVSQTYDHVVVESAKKGGPREFVTSDECANCHNATGTLAGMIPNMIFGGDTDTPVNLSQYGEWR